MITLNIYLFAVFQKYMKERIFLEISIIFELEKVYDSAWYDKSSQNHLDPKDQYQRHV